MFEKIENLRKLIFLIYLLMIPCIIFIIYQLLIRIDLPLKEIMIKDDYQNIDLAQVEMINKQYVRGNFFALDLNLIRKAFKKLPWVREVGIRRVWPDKLEVKIEEHRVIGRWVNYGLINDQGEIFNAAFQEDLPSFYGSSEFAKEMAEKFFEINKILQKELMQIDTITLSDRLSWEVQTNNQMKIYLGRKDVIAKLNLFIDRYQTVLQALDSRIEYVDLRYKNGFSIKKLIEPKKTKAVNNTTL